MLGRAAHSEKVIQEAEALKTALVADGEYRMQSQHRLDGCVCVCVCVCVTIVLIYSFEVKLCTMLDAKGVYV